MSADPNTEEERDDEHEDKQRPACFVAMAAVAALTAAVAVFWFLLARERKSGSTTTLSQALLCENSQCARAVQMLKAIMKPEVDPCHDFYTHVCGNYKHPSGQALIQMDDEMYRTLVRTLDAGWSLPSRDQSAAQKAGALYKNCVGGPLDETESLRMFVESVGLGLGTYLDAEALDKIIMLFFKYNVVTLLGMSLEDSNLSRRKRQLVLALGLSHLVWLTERSKNTPTTEFYLVHMRAFGLDPGTVRAFLWAINIVRVENVAVSIAFNPEILKRVQDTVFSTVERLQNYTPSIPAGLWASLVSKHSGGVYGAEDEVQVNLAAVGYIDQLYATLGRELSLLIAWELIRALMLLSSRKVANYFYKAEYIKSACIMAVMQAMQIPLLSWYLFKEVPQYAVTTARNMAHHIKKSVMEEIESATWLDSATKATAIEKARAMDLLIGYPSYFRSEKELNLVYSSYPDINTNFLAPWLDVMNKTITWKITNVSSVDFSVARTNAMYLPYRNKMVLPAPALQPPMFSPALPKAINYGSLGGVIGHEITHGFDVQGSQIDAQGRWRNWWSNRSREQYTERVLCLRRSHGASDGETDSENMADFGGVVSSHQAFVIHGDRWTLGELKYDAKQLFFVSSCLKWCAMANVVQAKQYAAFVDRCNVPLKNMEAFADAFECPTGAAMRPSSRCSMW